MNLHSITTRSLALLFAAGFTAAASADNTDQLPDTNEPTDAEAPVRTDDVGLDMENGVLPIADDRGFTLQSKDGKFVFKPYLYLQTTASLHYYDDEGLDKAYNQDNIANSGFAIPYGIIGFTGRAFGKIDYNVSINAAASGGAILQQAWIDYSASPAIRFRVGKQKTPYTHAYLTTLGETLFPMLPTSLTAATIMPHSLNAVTPAIGTGFDLGVQMHGLINNKWGYEVGIYNGTGGAVNTATKGFSDDNHFPSLLYAGRFTFQPNGPMPATQGNAKMLNQNKFLVGLSLNYNNEAESESTNDFRAGLEFAMLSGKWYFAAEAYYMNVGFTKRQKIKDHYNYFGAYAQVGYFLTPHWQLGLRYDWFDRNGSGKDGSLNSPAVVCNYYIPKTNIKLSGMYQFNGRWGHATQLDRDLDDLGISTHSACLMLQYAF
ncbi:MAG: outer membrane beta-barrel protein [Alloprevotella sp.]|nr:outer membrane beta-barrel protein [Alloprevotella sp.]